MHAQGQHALSQASTGMIVRASQAIHHDESKMLVLQSCSFTTKGLSETYLVAFLVFVIFLIFYIFSNQQIWSPYLCDHC